MCGWGLVVVGIGRVLFSSWASVWDIWLWLSGLVELVGKKIRLSATRVSVWRSTRESGLEFGASVAADIIWQRSEQVGLCDGSRDGDTNGTERGTMVVVGVGMD